MRFMVVALALLLSLPAFADGIVNGGPSGSSSIISGTTQSATPFATGIGSGACNPSLITGVDNTCFGYQAGKVLTAGTDNTFIGFDAGLAIGANTTNTIAIGSKSLQAATSGAGSNNTAIGTFAMGFQNVSGQQNIGIGNEALVNLTTGGFNVCIGGFSCAAVTTQGNMAGSEIGIGWEALQHATGQYNIAIGHTAGSTLTTGNQNIIMGWGALPLSTDCVNCVAIGVGAMASYVSGAMFNVNSVAIGTDALQLNTSGYESIAIGTSALGVSTSGWWNTAIGVQAMQALNSGNSDTCVGLSCFAGLTSGTNNTGLGQNAAFSNTATDLSTGSNNTVIGYNALFGSSTQRNQATVIGANAIGVLFDNSITLGRVSGATVDTTFVGALAGAGAAPALSGSCAVVAGTQKGGNTVGEFAVPAGNCATATTVILTFAATAPNGWACDAHDVTTPTSIWDQTGVANETTTATFTIRAVNAAAGDIVKFKCMAY